MRIIVHAIFLILFAAVQTTWIHSIELFNVVPNIFLVYIIVASCFCGKLEGAVVGFVFGMLLDMLSGEVWGVYALFGMILGFSVANFCEKLFGQKNVVLTLILSFVCTCFLEFVYYLICYASLENISLKYAFLWVVLPESIYNTIIAVPIYLLFRKIAKLIYSDKGETLG